MTRQNLERLQAIPWAKAASFVWAPNTAVYFPVFYIPVAIAIGVTKDLHFSPYTAILSARVVNALCFLLIGSLALLIARRGRPLLFAVLALPMTIALAASCNEDGLLIATFVLAAALLTRAEGPRGWPYMLGGMLLALVITVKIPYLPLAALMLIPLPGNSAGGQKRSWITGLRACFPVIAPGLLWAALNGALFTGPIVTRAPYHPGPFWPGDPATTFTAPHADAQLQVLAHHPQLLILLPFRDIQRYFADLVIWDSVIGRLAWMDVVLPRVMYTCWWIALAAAILSEALDIRTRLNRQWQIATIGLFAMIGGFVTLCASEYLAWTNVGAYFVDGIQGRYLIPLLASIALFVPALRMRHGRVIGAVLACPVFIMAAVGMVFLPILIVRTYYLTG